MAACCPQFLLGLSEGENVVRISSVVLLAWGVVSRRVRADTSSMLRVTAFVRPCRVRFCSTIIVRDMTASEQKEPRQVCLIWPEALMHDR
jgi:hypothetical protein